MVNRASQHSPVERIATLEALLAEASAAHAEYEKTVLNGVYDEQWPRWYAAYAVDQGVGELIGRDVTADELADFLAQSWDEQRQAGESQTETWEAYTARRIADQLAR